MNSIITVLKNIRCLAIGIAVLCLGATLTGCGSGSDDATIYTVTYDGNENTGGTVPASTNAESGQSVTVAGNTGNLVKTFDTFAGWNTKPDGSGTSYDQGALLNVQENITLFAMWKYDEALIEGSWMGPAVYRSYTPGGEGYPTDQSGNTIQVTYRFSGNSFERTQKKYYGDHSTADQLYEIHKITGTFVIGKEIVIGTTTAREIDYTVSTMTLTAVTTDAAEHFSMVAMYGYTDWEINVAKDITGRKMNDYRSNIIEKGAVLLDIFKIDGIKLYTSVQQTVNAAANTVRPTALNDKYLTKMTVIDGKWLGQEVWGTSDGYPGAPIGNTVQVTLKYSGNSWLRTQYKYKGHSTDAAQMYEIIEIGGTFVIGEDIPAGTSTAKKINTTRLTMTLTPLTQESVDVLNSQSAYGYNDWAVKVTKDVIGKQYGTNISVNKDSTVYDIFQIEGCNTAEGAKIYFSNKTNGVPLIESQRPNEIDVKNYYTKQ